VFVRSQPNGASNDDLDSPSGYQDWPIMASIDVDIPEWAVKANVIATLSCQIVGTDGQTASGRMRINLAGVNAPATWFNTSVHGVVEGSTFLAGHNLN